MREGLGSWKGRLDYRAVERIQNSCDFAMKKFGYREILDAENVYKNRLVLEKFVTVEKLGCLDCEY